MAIYSNNKMNSINENYSYTHNDIGLILYESEINNMRLFEASLQADFTEICGIREGTLLEAEAAATDEANKIGLKKRIIEILETIKRKIKEVFDNAISAFNKYIMRDGKEFVKDFDKVWSAVTSGKEGYRKFDDTIKDVVYEYNIKGNNKLKINTNDISKMINEFKQKNRFEDGVYDVSVNANELKVQLYNYLCGTNDIADVDGFIEYIKAAVLNTPITIDSSNVNKVVDEMKAQLSNNAVKDLKETKDKCLEVIKSYQDQIDKDDNINNIGYYNMLTSAVQNVITTLCSTEISCAKTAIKNSRKYLGAIMKYVSHPAKTAESDTAKELVKLDDSDVEEIVEEIEEAVMLADDEIRLAFSY